MVVVAVSTDMTDMRVIEKSTIPQETKQTNLKSRSKNNNHWPVTGGKL